MSNEEVERKLKEELLSARARMSEAELAFQRVLDAGSHSLPPDAEGTKLVQKVSREYQLASEKYTRARLRYLKFATLGVVPQDLKD